MSAAPAVRPRPATAARPLTVAPRPRRVSGPARPASRPARPPVRRVLEPRPTRERSSAQEGILRRLLASLERLPRRLPLAGRTGIGLVAFALIGIVTLQLGLLKLNAGIGRALEREAVLQRENAALSIEDSELASAGRVTSQAARLGMQFGSVAALRFVRAPQGARAGAAVALRAAGPASSTGAATGAAESQASSATAQSQGSAETPGGSTASAAGGESNSSGGAAARSSESAGTGSATGSPGGESPAASGEAARTSAESSASASSPAAPQAPSSEAGSAPGGEAPAGGTRAGASG